MAANTSPIFLAEPIMWVQTLSSQTSTAAGVGSLLTLGTAGAEGALIESLRAVPLGTNVASSLLIFIQKAGTGTNYLIQEVALASTTATSGATVPTTVSVTLPDVIQPVGENALRLGATDVLKVALSTAVAAGYNIVAIGGQYSDA